MKREIVVLVSALVLLGGCTGDDGASRADVVSALAADIRAADGTGGGISRSEARCVAEGFVDAIGLDNLVDLGIDDRKAEEPPRRSLGEGLTRAQRNEAAAVLTDGRCLDFAALIASQMAAVPAFRSLSRLEVECFFGQMLQQPRVQQAFADSLLGDGAADVEIRTALSDTATVRKNLERCDISEAQLQG